MNTNSDPLSHLIRAFQLLPGVGEKTATRFAFFILREDPTVALELSQALVEARTNIRPCESCGHMTERTPCAICAAPGRDASVICVVESSQDLLAIERSHAHRGVYHVLHGVIAPLDGVGPDDLPFRELVGRVKSGAVREVILATNPSVEGETTALYAERLLAPLGVAVTRIASGVSIGADIEYTDPTTIQRALEARRAIRPK